MLTIVLIAGNSPLGLRELYELPEDEFTIVDEGMTGYSLANPTTKTVALVDAALPDVVNWHNVARVRKNVRSVIIWGDLRSITPQFLLCAAEFLPDALLSFRGVDALPVCLESASSGSDLFASRTAILLPFVLSQSADMASVAATIAVMGATGAQVRILCHKGAFCVLRRGSQYRTLHHEPIAQARAE